jgi:plasmid stability protein
VQSSWQRVAATQCSSERNWNFFANFARGSYRTLRFKAFGIAGNFFCAINDCSDIIAIMASITIRRLPENTKRRLRMRAARNGRSMEQEARELLEAGLARADAEPENLGEAIHKLFAPFGGVDLQIPKREPIPQSRIKKLFQ